MRGLTIVVADGVPERFRTALALAAAQAALGGRTRLFLQGEAVGLLCPPIESSADPAHADAGLPTLAALLDDAIGLGVEIIACQSGLLLTGSDAASLDPRLGFGGLVSLLQSLGDDRLLAV